MPRTRQPTFFIPHGAGPCFFMDWQPADMWQPMELFLRGLIATLPERPEAILIVTPHWMEESFAVGAAPAPHLIYDYYGFPPHTYELRYPAPGNAALAARVAALAAEAGLALRVDRERGLDHGVFIPMKLVDPEAEIPVVPLAIRADLSAEAHMALGEALAPLRDEGVLILGSGMSFHNMRGYRDPAFTSVAAQFDAWLTAVAQQGEGRAAALSDWASAPGARLSHPERAEEHLLPLMVAAGAAGMDAGERVFTDTVMEVAISAFRFG